MSQMNQGRQMQQNQQFGGGLAELFGGLFGHSDDPYKKAREAYQPYFNQATGAQQPYSQAGQAALGPYQQMLHGMSDPSGFINHLMGQYQESPFAKYQQQQSIRAGQNAASMGGLPNGLGGAGYGSTPFAQQLQQNAQNISSQDMQNWLGRALGVNTQALGGYGNLISGGQGAANQLSNLYGQGGENMAQFAFGQGAGRSQDFSNMFGGLGNLLGSGIFGNFGR
jgi:hypothetical protein